MPRFIVLVLAALLLCAPPALAQQAAPHPAEQTWQLLDYVAVDYKQAVHAGQVVSAAEYAEMLDFAGSARVQLAALPPTTSTNQVIGAVEALRAAILRKEDAVQVAGLARHAAALMAQAYPLSASPPAAPVVGRGRELYALYCADCHGNTGNGDGPLAAGLEPAPIAFTDAGRSRERSVMALYQAISRGVDGTAMPAYEALPASDRWALAYFVGTMHHDEAARERGMALWDRDSGELKRHVADLAALTTTTEAALSAKLGRGDARDLLAYLRANPGAIGSGKPSGLALARLRLQESLDARHRGDRAGAIRLALSSYLDGIEPIEPMVRARDASLLAEIENGMLAYRSILAGGTTAQADIAAGRLQQLFGRIDALARDGATDPLASFFGAFVILLREGVEALLIVIAMVAFLNKAGRREALAHVHAGWACALLAGALTWAATLHIIDISGASREVIEGVGAIVAAVILLGTGLWMHRKSAAGRWQAYLEDQLSTALGRRSAWGLFALAFIAVYREVFETAIFYSALAADGNGGALAAGFLAAVGMLFVIAWVLLRTSARVPLSTLFTCMSAVIAILAIILTGKGVAALQEAGLVGANVMGIPRLELFGIYPTLEAVGAQGLVATLVLAGFGINWISARSRMRSQPSPSASAAGVHRKPDATGVESSGI